MIQRALVPSPFFLTEVLGVLSGSRAHGGKSPEPAGGIFTWGASFHKNGASLGRSQRELCPPPCVLVPPTARAAGLRLHAPALALAVAKAAQVPRARWA